jgi:hypothetical protein
MFGVRHMEKVTYTSALNKVELVFIDPLAAIKAECLTLSSSEK